MVDVDRDLFDMYFLRMKNGDWQEQTIKNLISTLKRDNKYVEYLSAKGAFDKYKLNVKLGNINENDQ